MKLNNKGFSLVELLLAVVISTVVFGAITALIAFSSRSMRDTNARVELQNQAKDALNHIESYSLEAERAYWDQLNRILILFYDEKEGSQMIKDLENGDKTLDDIKDMRSDSYVYWFKNNDGIADIGGDYSVYFGKCSPASTPAPTPGPAPTLIPGATPTPAPPGVSMPSIVDVSQITAINSQEDLLKNYLLADEVKEFDCKILENGASKKYVLGVNIVFDDSVVPEYSCGKRIYMRNQ